MQTISPPVYVGPTFQQLPVSTRPWETAVDPGTPFPTAIFPIPGKNYIDGLGSVITPTRVVGGLGN
jgi:hypothetical protein